MSHTKEKRFNQKLLDIHQAFRKHAPGKIYKYNDHQITMCSCSHWMYWSEGPQKWVDLFGSIAADFCVRYPEIIDSIKDHYHRNTGKMMWSPEYSDDGDVYHQMVAWTVVNKRREEIHEEGRIKDAHAANP